MFVPFLALPLAIHLTIFVADNVPKLDVTPSCRAASAAASDSADRMQSCLVSEERADNQLAKEWSEFPSADRANCVNVLTFEPTYTELLTCLEMTRELKKN